MAPTSPRPADKPATPATSAVASPATGTAAALATNTSSSSSSNPTSPPALLDDDAPVTETSAIDLMPEDDLHALVRSAASAAATGTLRVGAVDRLVAAATPESDSRRNAAAVDRRPASAGKADGADEPGRADLADETSSREKSDADDEDGGAPALAPGPTRRLHVRHETTYDYDATVELAHHLAHLRPRNTAEQQVQDWALEISPAPDALRTDRGKGDIVGPQRIFEGADVLDAVESDDDPLRQGLDGWGNWRCSFSHSMVHESLRVVSTFSAELCPPQPIDAALSPPWEDVAERLRYHPGELDDAEREAVEFALASYYAPRDAALRRYAAPLFPPGRPLLQGALALMHEINEDFDFRPHATSVATRATDALKLRKGVCQDFAHVMIGALRSLGLAARYVSGYLLTRPPPGQARLVGADASHAWVAVWCPLHGWIALDPTNAVRVGLDHVTLAWGRDYADVAPLRGVIRGSGRAVPQVAVTVEPEEPEAA
jgi:transglutaminase-like putative cysteine protease